MAEQEEADDCRALREQKLEFLREEKLEVRPPSPKGAVGTGRCWPRR